MNVNFVPSLEHFTLAKIAIALCNNNESKALLKDNRYADSCESKNYFPKFGRLGHPFYKDDRCQVPNCTTNVDLLKQIHGCVSDMIAPLGLGRILGMKILSFIPHIVLEIRKWEEDYFEVLPSGYDAQVYFCWKSVGTIDREMTAENLLQRGNLSTRSQFLIACLHCMHDRLSSLWDNIYDSHKAYLISKCHSGSLINYWTTRLDGIYSRGCTPDASNIINISALQYFYHECRSEGQKRAFLNYVLCKQRNNLDVVCFCVSKLCQNENEELTSLQCYNILACFLNWPLQGLFLDATECLLFKLDLKGMKNLMHDILRLADTHRYEDFDYSHLFKELLELIPPCHKDALRHDPEFQPIMTALE